MSIFNAFNTSASALTAQRLRMDVISSNTANAQTTRARIDENGDFEPYRRKMVVTQPNGNDFRTFLQKAKHNNKNIGNGVKVSGIVGDRTPFKTVFDPSHPDANDEGYVQYPNVDPLKEMVDLMSATRSYEANVTTMNSTKGMLMKALEIGR